YSPELKLWKAERLSSVFYSLVNEAHREFLPAACSILFSSAGEGRFSQACYIPEYFRQTVAS
ncbi:MAG: hypothetical protein QNJ78_16400, partial [Gammaproteobacteria bacterium]|nr:hypothetical protein [Gammaproteobacteria bacterium]